MQYYAEKTSNEAAANNVQSIGQPFKSHVPGEHIVHLIPTPKGYGHLTGLLYIILIFNTKPTTWEVYPWYDGGSASRV